MSITDTISEYLTDINERFFAKNIEDAITENDMKYQKEILEEIETVFNKVAQEKYNMGYLAGYRDGMTK